MSGRSFRAALLCATVFLASAARAAEADDLRSLRDQVEQLKAAYESRIRTLEDRVQRLQQGLPLPAAPSVPGATAAAAPGAPPPSTRAADAAPATGGRGIERGAASAYNPAISLILNGSYARLSRDPADYRLQGFMPSGGEVGPGQRSFSLGESELVVTAAVDPTFSGRFIASITPDNEITVEEALFERQGLFEGATLTGGRMLSAIGYLNSQHAHAWDFVDAPLAYQAFFGGRMQTDGLRLHWLAPTQRYFAVGAELGAGRGFPGNDTRRNGVGGTALFAHLGDDVGESGSWRAGMSYVANRARDRAYVDQNALGDEVTNRFSGRSRTWVLDGVYKWAPGGNARRTYLKVQGEYFRRRESGTLAQEVAGGSGGEEGGYQATQSGWYLQTVYQFVPMWRAGVRYDRLDSGAPAIGLVGAGTLAAADFPRLQAAKPSRTTLMVDYSLSEFSRLRLQWATDRSNPAVRDRQLILQYIMSLGAHGAHTF